MDDGCLQMNDELMDNDKQLYALLWIKWRIRHHMNFKPYLCGFSSVLSLYDRACWDKYSMTYEFLVERDAM
jgi:hypothetical protein